MEAVTAELEWTKETTCPACGAAIIVYPDECGLLPEETDGDRCASHHWRACQLNAALHDAQVSVGADVRLDNLQAMAHEAKELADATTPGPWEQHPNGTSVWSGDRLVVCVTHCDEQAVNDTGFIAEARTAVPELAAAVETLAAEARRLRAELRVTEQKLVDELEAQTRLRHELAEARRTLDDAIDVAWRLRDAR